MYTCVLSKEAQEYVMGVKLAPALITIAQDGDRSEHTAWLTDMGEGSMQQIFDP